MKMTTTIVTTVIATVGLTAPLLAEDPPAKPALPYNQADKTVTATAHETLGRISKGSDLLGAKVKNLQDEKLGHIQELAVDLESGRVILAILSVGGFVGVGDHLVAVPPASFSQDPDQTIRLDADKAKLKGAPEFEFANWQESSQADKIITVYRYYNVPPYFIKSPESDRETTPIGFTEKASKLIGMKVKNYQDVTVGKVDNLMVDLPAGRVVGVIVSAGGFLGIGDELNPVPPTAFRYNPARDALLLDVSKDALTKAPRLKSQGWPDASNPDVIVEVYRYYRIEPYFDTSKDANNTARNARDRNTGSLTPLDQGASDIDMALTRSIRTEIRKQDGLSVDAQNVKIITRDGRVTLRGPVASEDEKSLLAGIAERHARAGNVDNQLEVKNTSVNK